MSQGTWIDHFPGNFMWSNATLVCKGMAPYGAVAIGEIDRIAERLAARGMGDPDAWWQEWCAMAEKNEALADKAAAEGRDFTAGDHYLRAGNYYYTGERFVPPGDKKLDLYKKALRCSQEEMSVLFAGLEFARRGINTLAIDGPGQGESLRLRKIYARHDYEVPGTAAYEFVARRADVDPKKVVIMGYSFGGYYAPRIAAFERRYAACVCLGALHWDLHAWQSRVKEQLKADPLKSAQSNFQFQWILGLNDSDAALERSKEFSLAGVADKITCPVLITHGANDRVVPVEAAHKLHAALTTKKKTLRIFTAEEGGAEHCQVDNRPLGIGYIADWIAGNIS